MPVTGQSASDRIGFGPMLADWETRIDYDRLHAARLQKTRDAMAALDVDYLLLVRVENQRYAISLRRLYWPTPKTGGGTVIPRDGAPHTWVVDVPYVLQTLPGATEETLHEPLEYDIDLGAQAFCEDLLDVFGSGFASARIAVDLWTPSLREAFDRNFPEATLINGQELMRDAQAVKLPQEIACIKMAYAISEAGMQAALDILRPGVRESELVGECFRKFADLGSEAAQCSEVVNSGPGTYPYRRFHTDRIIQSGDLVNMDFGANFNGYWGDFCRPFVCGRPPSKAQAQLLREAYEYQMKQFAMIVPGKTAIDICTENGVKGLGHGFGISPNGPPGLRMTDTRIIEPGMTFAVGTPVPFGGPEAGGVHLEDMVVVTEDGCEVISTFPYTGIDET